VVAGWLLPVLTVQAQELNYNIYHLSADAEIVVENDLMHVTLTASHQANRAKQASEEVNKQMTWALRQAKGTPGVKVQTGSYQTNAVYKDSKIVGWRANQRLELKSSDFESLANLVGDLQEQLKVSSMQFKVSKPAKDVAEDNATEVALTRFRHRAKLIQSAVGAKGFKVVSVQINLGGSPVMHHRGPLMSKARGMMAADMVEVEGGSSTLRVQVSGDIQLEL